MNLQKWIVNENSRELTIIPTVQHSFQYALVNVVRF